MYSQSKPKNRGKQVTSIKQSLRSIFVFGLKFLIILQKIINRNGEGIKWGNITTFLSLIINGGKILKIRSAWVKCWDKMVTFPLRHKIVQQGLFVWLIHWLLGSLNGSSPSDFNPCNRSLHTNSTGLAFSRKFISLSSVLYSACNATSSVMTPFLAPQKKS